MIVIEDGTGVSNANSYVSEAEADAYFTARNNTTWASKTQAEKEAALIYATVYLDGHYYWVGHIANESQSLGWARTWAYDSEGREIPSNIVPQRVKDACCELALYALSNPLTPALARGGEVKRQKVGSLEVEYFEDANTEKTFPLVNNILSGLYKKPGSTILMRA
nr:hypothetical protein 13 [bacterium]